MNTKVEEALAVMEAVALDQFAGAPHMAQARATLLQFIAQQDATIARAVAEVLQFREVAAENDRLRAALQNAACALAHASLADKTYEAAYDHAIAALNQEQVK